MNGPAGGRPKRPLPAAVNFALGILVEAAAVALLMGIALLISSLGY